MDPALPPQGSPASSTTLTDSIFHYSPQGQYHAAALEQQWPRHIIDSPCPVGFDPSTDGYDNFTHRPSSLIPEINVVPWASPQPAVGYLFGSTYNGFPLPYNNEEPWTPLQAFDPVDYQEQLDLLEFPQVMVDFHGGDPSHGGWNNMNLEASCYQDGSTTVTLMPLSASNLSSGNTFPSPLTPSPVARFAQPEQQHMATVGLITVGFPEANPPSVPREVEVKAASASRRRRQPPFPRLVGGRVQKKPIPKYKEGQVMFDSIEGRNTGNPRAPFQPERRKEVAAVRARGSCFRCRMSKRKVSYQLTPVTARRFSRLCSVTYSSHVAIARARPKAPVWNPVSSPPCLVSSLI